MAADLNCLDHHLCEEMAEHVEKITLSGEAIIDVEVMKKFKKICRISDLYVKHAYHMLMSTLENDHAEIRLSTFKMIDELFNRSHCFRDLLVSEFQRFLELTVETDHDQPLPPPLPVAKKLKAETLKAIQQWFEKFGDAYKKLSLGYNFLKSCKLVDFNDIRTRTIAERQREEEKERKRKAILDLKLSKALDESKETVPDIETCKMEIENCLNLLLPTPDDFFISEAEPVSNNDPSSSPNATDGSKATHSNNKSPMMNNGGLTKTDENSSNENISAIENNSSEAIMTDSSDIIATEGDSDDNSDMEDVEEEFVNSETRTDFVNDYGLGSRKYNLNIEIKPKKFLIEETDDNKDIFKTLRDSIRMVKVKYLPKVARWLEIMGKAGAPQDKMKEMIDLKNQLEVLLNKCVEMKVTGDADLDYESDDDDDFEEVPEKDGYEAEVPFHLLTATEMGLKEEKKKRGAGKRTNKDWSLKSKAGDTHDPTTRAANLSKFGLFDVDINKPGTSSNKNNNIPTVPFGPDLAHWENPDDIKAPMMVKYDSLHRFWTPAEHESEKASQHDLEALKSRTFHYAGKFTPVTWKCRAPLPNGSLCERMDRVKCPFHGKIIGRDNTGKPTNIEEARKLAAQEAKKVEDSVPDWRDPELQRDIELSLGIDLGSSSSKSKGKGKGKGKGKNKKYANLTDVKEIKNTSRSRLEKRVFNRRAMKRVTSVMDAADFKRVRDKFGNQFNYAHER